MINITNESDCFGCGACASGCTTHAIAMEPDKKGFLYPVIEASRCIDCGKCDHICERVHKPIPFSERSAVYAVQHKCATVLQKSSSGGVFIALSDYVLKNGGIVVGAVFDPKTQQVMHTIAFDESTRDRMCGSKYVQSSIVGILPDIIAEVKIGRLVLFSGTPCQIAALRAHIGDLPCDNLYLIDVICHGVPSPAVFKSHITYEEAKYHSNVTNYEFRSKIYGYEYSHCVSFENGRHDASIDAKRILKLFTLNMRESCYFCPFASKSRMSDISIGDFWKAQSYVNVDCHVGCSAIIVNSIKGENLIEMIRRDVKLLPINIEMINQQALSHPVKRREAVDAFWNAYFTEPYTKVLDRYAPKSLRSFTFFYMIKALHILKQNRLIEEIKKRVTY